MPRSRKTETITDDEQIPLPELDQDPAPSAERPSRLRRLTAARATPATRGPGRPRKAGPRTPAGRIMSKAQMIAQVEVEVTMYLELAAAGWSIRDPYCAATADSDRLAIIAQKMTAMIARNDSMLALATKTGIIGDIVALIHAAAPIAKAVWQAHGPNGHGHGEHGMDEHDYDRYPAYAGAAAATG